MNVVEFIIKSFIPVSLLQMDEVKLMNRVDTKYICSLDLLSMILFDINQNYKILEIDNQRIMSYETIYYDTIDFQMYIAHQNGKLNRYKIRRREYKNSGKQFFEIKFKNNKGRTIKSRISRDLQESIQKNIESRFIEQKSPYSALELEPKLLNRFKRITLAGKDERITIDFSLFFGDGKKKSTEYFDLVVIEVKQENRSYSTPIMQTLKNYKVQPASFSKYCIGASTLYSQIKSNQFKEQLINLNKHYNNSHNENNKYDIIYNTASC